MTWVTLTDYSTLYVRNVENLIKINEFKDHSFLVIYDECFVRTAV